MKERILVIDDEKALLESLRMIISSWGYEVLIAETAMEGVKLFKEEKDSLSLVITDLYLPGGFDGIELLEILNQLDDTVPVIMITAFGRVELAVKAMQRGAFTFLSKPIDQKVFRQQIEKALEHRTLLIENRRLKETIRNFNEDKYRIIYRSEKIARLLKTAAAYAQTDETILITGESGTGKELLARYILRESGRSQNPFVAFNAAAVHPNLVESELFGHKKGAFTGADRNMPGYIGTAQGGTIFIDEIGDMPLQIQSKLLRFLQEKEYIPLGSSFPLHADVRVIAATNKNLEKEMVQGRFREDLYYRLSKLTLHLPPLRERREDIPLLARYFWEKFSKEYKREVPEPGDAMIRILSGHDWRGNVRELEQEIARYMFSGIINSEEEEKAAEKPQEETMVFYLGQHTMREIEKEIISATLRYAGGNKSRAAELLGISERSIYRKITGDEEI